MSQILERPDKTLDRFEPNPERSYTMPASYCSDSDIPRQEKYRISYNHG